MAKLHDLEDKIMSVWSTKDDVNLLYKNFFDVKMTEDEVANTLLGIMSLHEMRCKELFDLYEKLIAKKAK